MKSFRDLPQAPELVEIGPGRFRMGSDHVPDQMYIDETPARDCSVDRQLAVGKYPVTFQELQPFVEAMMPRSPMASFVEECAQRPERLPAVMVSWYEACGYCDWLVETTRQQYRLLTEVEWEYVCRARTETEYWWGDEFDPSRANCRREEIQGVIRTSTDGPFGDMELYSLTIGGTTLRAPGSFHEASEQLRFLTPVDKYRPNPWGIFDLHGNVWEWVHSVYEDRRTKPALWTPRGGSEPYRCVRGGSWMDPALSLRSAARSWAYPTARDRNIGFRVARTL